MSKPLDRRDFIGRSLAAVTAPAVGFTRYTPHATLVVGVMGLNSRGAQLTRDLAKLPDVEVAYLCDVDQRTYAPVVAGLAPIQKCYSRHWKVRM